MSEEVEDKRVEIIFFVEIFFCRAIEIKQKGSVNLTFLELDNLHLGLSPKHFYRIF